MVADGRGPPRRRRRLEPPRSRPVDAAEEIGPGRPGDPRRRARRCPPPRSRSTRRARPSPRPRSTPAPTCSTTSGASPTTRRWCGSPPARGVPIVLMHNRAEPRYRERRRRGRRGPPARARPRAATPACRGTTRSSTRASGSARRPTTTSRCWRASARCACWAGRSCSGRRASRRSGGCWTCPPDQRRRGDARDDGARDRRGRRPRARPRRPRERAGGAHRRRRSSAAGGRRAGTRRRAVTDRILLDGMAFEGTHGVHETSSVTPQPFEVDVELALNLAARRPVRRPRADDRLRQGVRRPAARSSSPPAST